MAVITSITSPDNDRAYKASDSLTITVTFDQAVAVNTGGGTPTLQLTTGGTASYTGGDGTSTLTFSYLVAAGQDSSDLDYASTDALGLNGATIKESGGPQADASLTLPTPGAAGSLGANKQIVIDTTAPTLTITSAASAPLKIGETTAITFTFSETPIGFSGGDITTTGGSLTGLSATANPMVFTATFTPTAGLNGIPASITVAANSYADTAGNLGKAGITSISFDTLAPGQPGAPTLAAASDSGAAGDGLTNIANPVIEGTAEANAAIVLYDGATQIGTATANSGGKWSVAVPLTVGAHSLTVTQRDVAGNLSILSTAFSLTIESPPTPPTTPTPPSTSIDGMDVQIGSAMLAGGVTGTTVSIPVVGAGRVDAGGGSTFADIPLFSSGGANLLLAQLPQGYGLSASGANVGRTTASAFLTATIKAATPAQSAAEQAQLLGNGLSFLSQPGSDTSVLVMTIAPTSTAPTGALTFSGAGAPAGQAVALVIDAKGLAANSKLDLVDIDFATVVGKAEVSAHGGRTVLSGDAAEQHFTVAAGRGDTVFAGAGNDIISVYLSPSATGAKSQTVLYGGQGNDVVRVDGNRADYDIAQHNGHIVLTSKADPLLSSKIVNVEQLQFSDAVVAVTNSGSVNTLVGLYQAVLGRQADVGGIEFWANGRDAGTSWGSIVVSLINSSERLAANAGFNGNAEHDVTLLFNVLFQRAPDAAGLAFWRTAIENGASLVQVANGFVESVEMVGRQLAASDWNFQV